jgi:hypothetical protein
MRLTMEPQWFMSTENEIIPDNVISKEQRRIAITTFLSLRV